MELDALDFANRLDEYLERITPFGFSGALLVAEGERVLVRKGYGLADRASSLPNTAETVFCLGSITKQFTAAAVMKLAEMGRLDLHDPIGKYIGGVPADKASVTIHHLLTHTGGILNYTGGDYEPADHEHVLEKTLEAPLQFEPGSRYSYSNAGYSLLAAIVEYVSRQPYEQFLYENLLAPAGLEHTGYRRPNWDGQSVARWYQGGADNGQALEKHYPSWNVMGNGEMLSTLDDMLCWHQALMRGEVLGKAIQRQMYTPFLQNYGYGWRIEETDLGTLIEHNGASELGSSALYRRYVDAGLALVLFCNQSYGETPMVLPLQDKIEQILAGEPLELPPELMLPSNGDLAVLEGEYRLAGGALVGARQDGGGLVLSASGQEAINFLAFPNEPPAAHSWLNETTLSAFSAALDGDFEPLFAFMANLEARRDGVRRMIAGNIEAASSDLGAFSGLELVGTVPSSFYPDALDTVLTIRFENGSAGLFSISRGGKNVGVAVLEMSQGFVLPCTLGGDGLVGYHIPLGRVVRLDVLRGNDGGVEGLKSTGGDVLARRV